MNYNKFFIKAKEEGLEALELVIYIKEDMQREIPPLPRLLHPSARHTSENGHQALQR